MPVYVEALEPQKSDPHFGILWEPTGSGAGTLTIRSKRCDCRYHVAEFPVDAGFDGRGFTFAKPDGETGTDGEAGAYSVLVGRRGSRCECKGFERWGRCKHASAARSLIENGWLDLIPAALPTPEEVADAAKAGGYDDVPF
jgi:hypothetical protein